LTHFLAIDGGNSKTDVVIGTGDGRVLAYETGGGTCHQNIGLAETMLRLRTLVARARVEAGLAVDGFDRAEIYLAGADLPEELELLTTALSAEAWAREIRLENDTFALLRAGTDAADAVAVVCGAGTNCVGRTGDGRTARFPSLGRLSGDWGGGGHLAWLTLWHAVRAEDGRGPGTDLAKAVADHFGLSTAEEVGKRVHLGDIDWADLSGLAPLLFAAAAGGDGVARAVVARQAEEIVALATVAARRLGLLDATFTVVLGGGVLRARHPLLMDPVEDGIRTAAPKATITVVDAPPVLGAGLSALDALGSEPTAHAALRTALPHPLARPPRSRPPFERLSLS
jgi:N-acetylglucosamine kinase-like BadF-type ATPase